MAETNKTKREPKAAPVPNPLETAWAAIVGLADEARVELHKQAGAAIGLADGALDGATRFAVNLNDRLNAIAEVTIAATDRGGRQLAASTRESAARIASATRDSALRLAQGTRGAAERASATARTLVGTDEAKAA